MAKIPIQVKINRVKALMRKYPESTIWPRVLATLLENKIRGWEK